LCSRSLNLGIDAYVIKRVPLLLLLLAS